MTYHSKRAKATDIPLEVKKKVYERDFGVCVFCKRAGGIPNAHFISRAQGGLGIEQNILTLCPECHRKYDFTSFRDNMREYFRNYLKGIYPDWNEQELYYKKWEYERR